MGTASILLSALLFAPFKDFYREKASILVTQAHMSQINHGAIVAYYPNAIFWHHKELVTHETTEFTPGGYLSLDSKRFSETSIDALFSGPKASLEYKFTKTNLLKALSVIPSNHLLFDAEGNLVEDITLKTADNLKGEMGRYLFLPSTSLDSMEKNPEEKTTLANLAIADSSYFAIIGSPTLVQERFLALSKGVAGDGEAGKILSASHYVYFPLSFEITVSDPVEDEVVADANTKYVKGWVLAVSHQQSKGKLILPVIRPFDDKGVLTAADKSEKEIISRMVNLKEAKFQFSVPDFVKMILSAGTIPQSTTYQCIVDKKALDNTACRYQELAVPEDSEEEENSKESKMKTEALDSLDWYLDLALPQVGKPDSIPLQRNTFYLVGKNAKGVPIHYYRVNVLSDSQYIAPSSSKVPPVRDLTQIKPMETLK